MSARATKTETAGPLWRALRAADAPATLRELGRRSRAKDGAVYLRLRRWAGVGLVTVIPAVPHRYVIAEGVAHLVDPPTDGPLSFDVWTAMRRLGRPVSLEDLLAATGAADRGLYCRMHRWCKAGYVVRLDGEPLRYALSADGAELSEPPLVSETHQVRAARTMRERIWSAMRVLKSFDVPLLIITAEVTRRSVEDFLNLLERAGYVRINGYPVTRVGAGNLDVGRDWSTYRLVRAAGPKCPVITNPRSGDRMLVDKNTGVSVPIGPGLRQRRREANDGR